MITTHPDTVDKPLYLASATKRCHTCEGGMNRLGTPSNPVHGESLCSACKGTEWVPLIAGLRNPSLHSECRRTSACISSIAPSDCSGRGWVPVTGNDAMMALMEWVAKAENSRRVDLIVMDILRHPDTYEWGIECFYRFVSGLVACGEAIVLEEVQK